MTTVLHSQLKKESHHITLLPTLKFVGLGVLWIVGSDLALFLTQPSASTHYPIFHLEVLKGILFVLAMGIFFFTMQRKNERLNRELVDLDLFRKNSQAIFIYNLETMRFLDVNDAAIQVYGYSRGEFMSMKISDLRQPEDLPELMKAIEQLKNGDRLIGRSRHLHKNRSIIHTELSAYSITYNKLHAGLIMATDITAQVKAERALIEMTKTHDKQMNDRLYEVALFNKELQVRIREVNANNDELIEVNKLLQNANRNAVARYEGKIQRIQEAVNGWMENISDIFWTIDINDSANTFVTKGTLVFFNCTKKAILDQPNFWELSVHAEDKARVKNELLLLNKVENLSIQYRLTDGKTVVSHSIKLVRGEDEKVEKIEFQLQATTATTNIPKSPQNDFKSLSRDLSYQ